MLTPKMRNLGNKLGRAIRLLGIWCLFVVFVLSVNIITVSALSQNDIDSIYNDTVWYDGFGGSTCSTELVGSDNIEKAYNYFLGKGFSSFQAAGIVGNLMQESGVNPKADQPDGPGMGIAQWSEGGRWDVLLNRAKSVGADPFSLDFQLDFIWYEMNEVAPWSDALPAVKASTTLEEATEEFMNKYEAPGDPQLANRIKYAQQVLSLYGGGATPGTPSCGTIINCNQGAPSESVAGLSQVRQNVVCIAKQELALWESQPGYPTPEFSKTGYFKYSDNNVEDWCADFVSWVYKEAGYPFSGGLSGGWRIPAVATIKSIGEQNQNFHWHPAGTGYIPKPGDLALRDTSHVNIFISSVGGVSTYIGGNQGSGPYPGGSIVSSRTGSGYYDGGITGYVAPD